MIRRILLMSVFAALTNMVIGQDEGKKKLEADFERYKKEREQDYQEFVRKREAELKQMEQEYLDYYNQMMGLKKHYTDKKEPEKAQVVQDMIDYENKIAKTLGYKIPDRIKENQVAKNNTDSQTAKTESAPKTSAQSESKTSSESPSTLKADNSVRDGIPVLTPVPKRLAKITSPFGLRIHPTLGRPIKHNGVDFGSGRGAEVYAASSGKVVLADFNGSYGNYVIVEHQEGSSSVYAHLDKIVVSKGSRIKKGDLIGYTGNTGRTSGPHLHYEVRIKGIPVDPAGYLIESK